VGALQLSLGPGHGRWSGRQRVRGRAVREAAREVGGGVGGGRPFAGPRPRRHRERSERQRERQRTPQERSFRSFQMCSPGKSRAHPSGAKSVYVVSASAGGRSSMRSSIARPLARNRLTHSPYVDRNSTNGPVSSSSTRRRAPKYGLRSSRRGGSSSSPQQALMKGVAMLNTRNPP